MPKLTSLIARQAIYAKFEAIVGRAPSQEEVESLTSYADAAGLDTLQMTAVLNSRSDVVIRELGEAVRLHLFALHHARVRLMATMIPPARRIMDLGGANAPLCDAGYPHQFEELTIVDLPPADRHAEFANRIVEARETPAGRVSILYASMTDLSAFDDASVDLAWSGQSVEHITVEDARTMYREVRRVLRPDGWFCLDTPNGLVTRIHSPTSFIHPDHKVEYTPAELIAELDMAGFEVATSLGVCEMPLTVSGGVIDYRDFLIGAGISMSVESCYVQYHACRVGQPRRPRRKGYRAGRRLGRPTSGR